MTQGDIYLADLNPVEGSEQRCVGPVVIISGNTLNKHLDICIICPLTTKEKFYPGGVRLGPDNKNGLDQVSHILTFQIRTISKKRFIQRIGKIYHEEVRAMKAGLHDVLTL